MYDTKKKLYKILGRYLLRLALEIERDLLKHPYTAELAVLGIPNEKWGKRVVLICQMKEGKKELDLDMLRCWDEHHMACYKVLS
ncbi:hypothetical protein ACHAXS_004536 [Conticribra weissflogii]